MRIWLTVVPVIVGDKGQIMGHGTGCNDQINVIQGITGCFQIAFQHSEYFHAFRVLGGVYNIIS